MNLNQLTDTQLIQRLNAYCDIYLASCELDHDFQELEATLDNHYSEANHRGLM